MSEISGDVQLEPFRAEARAWIEANLPPSLRGKPQLAGPAPTGDLAVWRARLAERGWGAPTWPVEYGGGGLAPRAAAVLRQEMARVGACNPMVTGLGLTMIGPTLLDYGTEDQKRRHVPPIARGDVIWCLGYSEPNAGSDLAALQTKCEDKGDHWEVTGQKIWTSGAHYAHWCGALVRTDPRAPKHDGISFVMLRMDQPGVETRPIQLIAGASPFCEVFFTQARVERDDILGELNKGWTVGKRLLQHERASQTGEGVLNPAKPPPLEEIAKRYLGLDAVGRLADPDLRPRLTAHLMQARAHELTLARVAAESKANVVSNAASMLKNSATQVAQERAELLIEIMGYSGLGWAGEGFADDELGAVRHWLYTKSMSIYGGTFEVQNNIIAKRILGLPDLTRSA
jgi:alkylation response protein AidB-like acyl-CoA dehydrogenase